MKKKISKAVVIVLLSLGSAYGVLYAAHRHLPHSCPRAKRAHDHHCDKHDATMTHFQNEGDEVSVPQDCICPISCFFSGQGLPVD